MRSKARPVAAGDHMFFSMPIFVLPAAPWTISMAAKRTWLAAACARAARAGTIASRNGKATVTPMPRRTSRRESCFFAMNIGSCPLSVEF